MKHSVIQVCLSVFALCCPSVYGLTCLHCEDVPQPRHCHTVTRCEADELCLAERSATTHLYWLGCINQSLIKSLSHGSTRNGTVCSEFCGSDLCNAQACGEPGYPATRGPVCYNCNYHTDQHPCKTIDICSTDEECRIISKDEFGDTILTSGCKSRHDCQDPVVDTSTIVGKRTARAQRSSSHILCDKCCSDDLCNFNCSNDPCASSPCQHGLCISINKTYNCQCMAGWTGNICSDSITTTSVSSTTTASDCVDKYPTCESIGAFYCTDTYRSWSMLNCKNYCGWCNIHTITHTGTRTQSTTTPHTSGPDVCLYNGQSYTQGQTWHDGCQYNCTCEDASTGYYRCKTLCPSYQQLPPKCHLVTVQGQCCPTPDCTENVDVSTSHLGGFIEHNFCSYKGRFYAQNETWNDGCIQTCKCTDESRDLYSCSSICLKWDGLPSICHLEDAPPGKCCQQPHCTAGVIINIPVRYKDQYPAAVNLNYNYD